MPADNATILVVDDTPANLSVLLDCLPQHGFRVLVATSGEHALQQLHHTSPDLILLDVIMPGLDGFATCARLKSNPDTRDIPVIFMTALSETIDKVRGFEAGAVDYVTKPFQHEEVLARVTTHLMIRSLQADLEEANAGLERRVAERTAELNSALSEVRSLKNRLKAENDYLKGELGANDGILGNSRALSKVLHQVEQVAPLATTVLILGETGTGKELIARAVHRLSTLREKALIKVNCAALPPALIESELFGHEKGAFTGATKRRIGRFELAAGGTIFLDEIGDLPLELQAKLLRVLQEGEYERIGGENTLATDARVVAATNRNLERAIENGDFRQDLYYRLSVFPIRLPPLRERATDIPLLVDAFARRFAKTIGRALGPIPQETLDAFCKYPWPGNVRELQNVIERALIIAEDGIIKAEPGLRRSLPAAGGESMPAKTLEAIERSHIQQTLRSCDWVIAGNEGAAERLGLNPSTLRSRMKKLGIARPG